MADFRPHDTTARTRGQCRPSNANPNPLAVAYFMSLLAEVVRREQGRHEEEMTPAERWVRDWCDQEAIKNGVPPTRHQRYEPPLNKVRKMVREGLLDLFPTLPRKAADMAGEMTRELIRLRRERPSRPGPLLSTGDACKRALREQMPSPAERRELRREWEERE